MKEVLCFIELILKIIIERSILFFRSNESCFLIFFSMLLLTQDNMIWILGILICVFNWCFKLQPLKYCKKKLQAMHKSDFSEYLYSKYKSIKLEFRDTLKLRQSKFNLYIPNIPYGYLIYYFRKPRNASCEKTQPTDQEEETENKEDSLNVEDPSKTDQTDVTFSDSSHLESASSCVSLKREIEDTFDSEKKRHKSLDSAIDIISEEHGRNSTTEDRESFTTESIESGLFDKNKDFEKTHKFHRSANVEETIAEDLSSTSSAQDKSKEFVEFANPEISVTETVLRKQTHVPNSSLPNTSEFGEASCSTGKVYHSSQNVEFRSETNPIKMFQSRETSSCSINVPESTVKDEYTMPDIVSSTSGTMGDDNNNEDDTYFPGTGINLDDYNKIWEISEICSSYFSTCTTTIPKEVPNVEDTKSDISQHQNVDLNSSNTNSFSKINITPADGDFIETMSDKGTFGSLYEETNNLLQNVVQKLEISGAVSDIDKNKSNLSHFQDLSTRSSEEQIRICSDIVKKFNRNLKTDVNGRFPDLLAYEKLDSPIDYSVRDNTGKLMHTSESSVSQQTSSGSNIRSSSPVKKTSSTFSMYEPSSSQTSSKEIPKEIPKKISPPRKKYIHYPGLAAEPDKVKKDARYQKRFYKMRRALQNRVEAYKKQNPQSYTPYSPEQSDISDDQNYEIYYDESDDLSSKKSHSQKEPRLEDLENKPCVSDMRPYCVVGPERFETKGNFSDPNADTSKNHPVKIPEYTPLSIIIPEDSATETTNLPSIDLQMLQASLNEYASLSQTEITSSYFTGPSPKASPIRGPEDQSGWDSSGDVEIEFPPNISTEMCYEGLTDIDARNKVEDLAACYYEINFDTTCVRGKRVLYVRDQFHICAPTDTVMPLRPMFGIGNVRYVKGDGDYSVEEFLFCLKECEQIYNDMLYFPDENTEPFSSSIRAVEIPMRLPSVGDGDYELVGDELQIVSTPSLDEQLQSASGSEKNKESQT